MLLEKQKKELEAKRKKKKMMMNALHGVFTMNVAEQLGVQSKRDNTSHSLEPEATPGKKSSPKQLIFRGQKTNKNDQMQISQNLDFESFVPPLEEQKEIEEDMMHLHEV